MHYVHFGSDQKTIHKNNIIFKNLFRRLIRLCLTNREHGGKRVLRERGMSVLVKNSELEKLGTISFTPVGDDTKVYIYSSKINTAN